MVRNLVINTALILFSVLLALAAFDFAVYWLPKNILPGPMQKLAQQMEINSGKLYRRHPALGYVIKPETDFVYFGEDFSFRFQTRLNYPDAGFRGGTSGGPAWGAAFGDSFTFGVGVDQNATWVALLSKMVNREIINFGVPGHGPYQYTRVLKIYGIPRRPKIVFYTLFANDLKDGLRFQNRKTRRKRNITFKQFLKRSSASYNLVGNFTQFLEKNLANNTWDGIGLKLLSRKLRNPHDVPEKYFQSAWAGLATQIDDAIAESRRIQATFILLYFPSKEEVYWELVKARVAAIEHFEERIQRLSKTTHDFCEARQLLCLDLGPALKDRGLRGEIFYFPVDIHWNERGHLVVAQAIHKFLIAHKIVE
jgi:GDSL-like Lipase/Acylhydrolase family